MTASAVKWNAKAQERLTNLKAARDQSKAREAELIRERKDIAGQLRELGALSLRGMEKKLTDAGIPKKTVEGLMARNQYVITIFELEFFRERFKFLADKIDATIDEANQGKLFDDDDEEIPGHEPTEAELFVKPAKPEKDDEEDQDQQTLPIGEAKAKTQAEPVETGTAQHLRASTKNLGDYGLSARVIRCLEDASLDKVGKVIEFEVSDREYTAIAGIGDAAAKTIRDAVKKYLKEHGKAEIQVERDAQDAAKK